MSRSFVITPNLPYPTRSGADLRSMAIIESLTRVGEVGVFGIGRTRLEPPSLSGIDLWATSSSEAALAHDEPTDARWISEPDWVPSDRYFSAAIAEEISAALDRFSPDVVVLEQLVTAGYLDEAEANGARVVLDAHNVESHLHHQMAEAEERGVRKVVRRHFAERVANLESRVVKQVDRVWACSRGDQALLQAMGSAPVDVVPNGINTDRYANLQLESTENPEQPVVLFPANFGYEPNVRAARFIAEQLAPAVRQRWPDARFLLPGRDPQPDLVAQARQAAIEMPGGVDDILAYFSGATAMVVPLFEGGGTRLKILEAFAAKLPVIATSKAVEGLDVVEGVHFFPASSVDDFVQALAVITDDGREMTAAARELVESRYSQDAIDRAVVSSVDAILG